MRWCHRLETPDAEFVNRVRTVKYTPTHTHLPSHTYPRTPTLIHLINTTRKQAASRVHNLTAYARYTILLFCVCERAV